jgi:hypothetical protein
MTKILRRLSIVFALLTLPGSLAVADVARTTEQLFRPPFAVPWDVRRAKVSVSRVFTLIRRRSVLFEIEFYRTDGLREIATDPVLRAVVGDGSTVFVTEASADTDDPVIVKDYFPGQCRPPGQGVRARMAQSGTMITLGCRQTPGVVRAWSSASAPALRWVRLR